MRQAGNDREVAAEILENFQVRREFVLLARFLGEEKLRMQPERRADADHAARSFHGRSTECSNRSEVVEARQGQRDAGGAEEGSAGEFHAMILGTDNQNR